MFGFIDEKPVFTPGHLLGKVKNFPANVIITWHKNVFKSGEKYSLHSLDESKSFYNIKSDFFLGLAPILYRGMDLALIYINFGSPILAFLLEELSVLSVKNVFCVGSCGILDATIKTDIIVPTKALRDEGTSYHYLDLKEEIINISNAEVVSNYFTKESIPFTCTGVWSTDAVYRETKSAIKKATELECLCVDMECSAGQAVCLSKAMELYYFFFRADNLSNNFWKKDMLNKTYGERSLSYLDYALGLSYFVNNGYK